MKRQRQFPIGFFNHSFAAFAVFEIENLVGVDGTSFVGDGSDHEKGDDP